jgi:2-polyprenyl-3-methyl-5-hydroxy-6-metoxy-1,4-benzoquinol methylase
VLFRIEQMFLFNIKNKLKALVSPASKRAFLMTLPNPCSILDVGCGNDSPKITKSIVDLCYYVGIDIQDYNLTDKQIPDQYVITTPEKFSESIQKLNRKFDVVISSHNLEHCQDWKKTLTAMCNAISEDGLLYLSLPAEDSVFFPSRYGTLNYYDDKTHNKNCIQYEELILELNKMPHTVLFGTKNYQPKLLYWVGCILEPYSRLKKKVLHGTWAYYGFETIFIIKKIH